MEQIRANRLDSSKRIILNRVERIIERRSEGRKNSREDKSGKNGEGAYRIREIGSIETREGDTPPPSASI